MDETPQAVNGEVQAPAAPAVRRFKGGVKGRINKATPFIEDKVAAMRSVGSTEGEIARAMRLQTSSVKSIIFRPRVQQRIAEYRESIRHAELKRVKQMSRGAWDLAQEMVAAKDPRGFDATMRGLYSMEKIASSAAGEPQAQALAPAQPTSPSTIVEEAKVLIQVLLGDRR